MAAVTVEGLVKRYGAKLAVDDVSLAIEEGEIFGILGPNGAGKTTTVECIAGLRKPDAGHIDVLGFDPRTDVAEVRRILGVQLQESRLPDKLKVWEALDLYASFYERPVDWERLLVRLGLGASRNTMFAKLSGGQQQRISIALALVGGPRVVILDELTTGLDPRARRDTWELIEQIREDGVTVLLVSHSMDEVERLCDRIAVISDGRLIALDTPAGLIAGLDHAQRVRFVPSAPLDEADLTALPEVARVSREGRQLVVDGSGHLVHAVTSELARRRVVAEQLRVEQAGLDDAYLALTGRPPDNPDEQEA